MEIEAEISIQVKLAKLKKGFKDWKSPVPSRKLFCKAQY